jgi:diacylglycerol kinase (ATP)
LDSFKYAFRGIRLLLRYEHNARIHVVCGICVIIAGILLGISCSEWIAVIIVSGCVLAAEAFNSSVERLADIVSPGYSEAVRNVKDMAAGAVLLTAVAAFIIGLIIFLPRIISLH